MLTSTDGGVESHIPHDDDEDADDDAQEEEY